MTFVYELIISTEEYDEKEIEKLFLTPQDAWDAANLWNAQDESRPELPAMAEWDQDHWSEGMRLFLHDHGFSFKLIIVQRKVYGATA